MARLPRTTFAAPLVVTLAVAPACVIKSDSAPRPAPPSNPPPVEVEPTPVEPTTPEPPTPEPTDRLTTWTVYQRAGTCMAAMDVQCDPRATCNPPPPQPLDACPPAMAADARVKIVETAPSVCEVQYPAPTGCDPRLCNPPRPQAITCPR